VKIYKLGVCLLIVAWLFGLAPPGVDHGLVPARIQVQDAAAAPLVGPSMTIPSNVTASANSTVSIPITFASNGNDIASIGFSIDYYNTWLDFDPTLPFSITFNLPSNFVGECVFDETDTDGELDCYIVDPAPPIIPMPDGVFMTLRLRTLSAPGGAVAPVNFASSPLPTFGNDEGAYVPGSVTHGSVLFLAPPSPPPTGLTATLNVCSATLEWVDNSPNETGFKIERRSGILPYAEIASVGQDTTFYLDSGLDPLTTYYYRVRAYNIAGYSAYTNVAAVSTAAECVYPVYIPLVLKDYTTTTGSTISGFVRDASSSPLAGALVCANSACVSTNSSGAYSISGLVASSYNVAASLTGYNCTADFSNPVTVPPSASSKNFTCVATGPCSDIIVNGGFEEQHSWEIPITEYSAGFSNLLWRTGSWSMRTGITLPGHNRYSYSSARQLFTIPADATQATLSFYANRKTTEVALNRELAPEFLPVKPDLGTPVELIPLSDDIQMVLVLDTYDNIISYLMWGLGNKQIWQYRENNLLAFKGWPVKIYFGTYNDGYGGITSMHVDDVELEVCR